MSYECFRGPYPPLSCLQVLTSKHIQEGSRLINKAPGSPFPTLPPCVHTTGYMDTSWTRPPLRQNTPW